MSSNGVCRQPHEKRLMQKKSDPNFNTAEKNLEGCLLYG